MVFQDLALFPNMTIASQIRFAMNTKGEDRLVELLKLTGLEDLGNRFAHELSGGQQQRLCIARALATNPAVLLMDEPASALDPASTSRIEDLIFELKQQFTIVIVTHNMQQAARASDWTGFFWLGELMEYGATGDIFTAPQHSQTEAYVTGRYG